MTANRELIIVGGGEHARVVAEAARASGAWHLAGFVDVADRHDTAAFLGIPQLSDAAVTAALARGAGMILGIGGLKALAARQRLVADYSARGARWATVVHPTAWVAPSAVLAEGVFVAARAVINTAARVDAHGIVNTGSVIEHDVRLGSFTHAAPGTVIGGGTNVGADCYLGLGCRVRDHIEIGRKAVVGMGAVVVGAVGDGWCVQGVPAAKISDPTS